MCLIAGECKVKLYKENPPEAEKRDKRKEREERKKTRRIHPQLRTERREGSVKAAGAIGLALADGEKPFKDCSFFNSLFG